MRLSVDIMYDIIGQFVQSAQAPPQLAAAPAAASSLRRLLVSAALVLLSLTRLLLILSAPVPLRLQGNRSIYSEDWTYLIYNQHYISYHILYNDIISDIIHNTGYHKTNMISHMIS